MPSTDPDDTRNGTDRPEQGSSTLGARLRTAVDRFRSRWHVPEPVLEGSRLRSRTLTASGRLEEILANAWLARWLTREPPAETIVIDLRDSRVAGPIVELLDRVATVIGAARETAGVEALLRSGRSWLDRYGVAVVGLCLLLFVGYAGVWTWQGATPLWLLALAIVALAGTLALPVDRSRTALSRSRAVDVTLAVVAPPPDTTEK